MREWVLGTLLGGGLVLGVTGFAGGLPWQAAVPPMDLQVITTLAQQTAALERIAAIVERWDAERQAVQADSERQKTRGQFTPPRGGDVPGLQELPKYCRGRSNDGDNELVYCRRRSAVPRCSRVERPGTVNALPKGDTRWRPVWAAGTAQWPAWLRSPS
jgi:hypothetical protein